MAEAFRISIADLIDEAERRQLNRRTEECFELLEEVQDLEKRLATHKTVTRGQLAWRNHHRIRLTVRNQELREENDRLRAELELERSRYTLGGIPPRPSDHWENAAHLPPETASNPAAPPLRRGLVRKLEYPSDILGGAE
jgi:hypothetical protein